MPLIAEAPANPAPTSPTTQSSRGDGVGAAASGYLTAELGLTPDQRDRLDKIWSAVAKANDQDERRRGYRRERDEAIADLVPPARLGEYDQIIDTYTGRIEALERKLREAYETAVEETKAILTPEQRDPLRGDAQAAQVGPGRSGPLLRRSTGRGVDACDDVSAGPRDATSSPSSPSHD